MRTDTFKCTPSTVPKSKGSLLVVGERTLFMSNFCSLWECGSVSVHYLNMMSDQEAILGDGVYVQKTSILMLQCNSFAFEHF